MQSTTSPLGIRHSPSLCLAALCLTRAWTSGVGVWASTGVDVGRQQLHSISSARTYMRQSLPCRQGRCVFVTCYCILLSCQCLRNVDVGSSGVDVGADIGRGLQPSAAALHCQCCLAALPSCLFQLLKRIFNGAHSCFQFPPFAKVHHHSFLRWL